VDLAEQKVHTKASQSTKDLFLIHDHEAPYAKLVRHLADHNLLFTDTTYPIREEAIRLREE
jgi:hypothetical protein